MKYFLTFSHTDIIQLIIVKFYFNSCIYLPSLRPTDVMPNIRPALSYFESKRLWKPPVWKLDWENDHAGRLFFIRWVR
jgi:hypothetical protein